MNKTERHLLKEGLNSLEKSAKDESVSAAALNWLKDNPGLVGGGLLGSGLGAGASYLLGGDSWPALLGSGALGGLAGAGAGHYGYEFYKGLKDFKEVQQRLAKEEIDMGSRDEMREYLKKYHPEELEDGKIPEDHAANKLISAVKHHREDPDADAVAIPRSWVGDITEDQLEEVGFEPAYIAVPEAGQAAIRTYRHPFSRLHFHEYKDNNFMMHEDKWSALPMLKQRRDILNMNTGAKESLSGLAPLAMEGLKHGVMEGIPGYLSYARNRILGGPSFFDKARQTHRAEDVEGAARSVMNITGLLDPDRGAGENVINSAKNVTRTLTEPPGWRPPRAALSSASIVGAPALSAYALSRGMGENETKHSPYKYPGRAGTTAAGTLGGLLLGNEVRKKISGGFEEGSQWPRLLAEVGSPVIGGLGGYMLGKQVF